MAARTLAWTAVTGMSNDRVADAPVVTESPIRLSGKNLTVLSWITNPSSSMEAGADAGVAAGIGGERDVGADDGDDVGSEDGADEGADDEDVVGSDDGDAAGSDDGDAAGPDD